jgi:hypothetical protein
MGRDLQEWEAAKSAAAARRAARIPPPRPPRPRLDRTAIVLGRTDKNIPVLLPERARLEHAHAIGTTGGGKTKFLELCIRQDIMAGRGVCVVDPHGNHHDSLYRSLLGWMDNSGILRSRKVHLIDPNAGTHTTGFNPLARPDRNTDLSVIAGYCLDAFGRAWGNEDLDQKPTIKRVISGTFMALAELGLTLCEAELLYDPYDEHGVRAWALNNVRDRYARNVLRSLHQLAADSIRDFRIEVVGPTNRLAEFVRAEAIRTILGQTERMLDMREVLDEGHILLVNLAGGERVYEQDAALLGRLLTRCLLFHATRRRNPQRPFFVYLDECHRYLSGDLENILAEVRKYGVGMVLSHQWLEQLKAESPNMLAAVRNATNLKAIFRLRDQVDAEDLAAMAVPLDLERPVEALIRPTVVGNQRVWLQSESASQQHSRSDIRSLTDGKNYTEAETHADTVAETFAEGESTALSVSESSGKGTSRLNAMGSGLSQMSMSGTGSGLATTQMMTPQLGWLDTPMVLGVSEGESSMAHASFGSGTSSIASQGIGSTAMTARTAGKVSGESSMHAVSVGALRGQTVAYGISRAETVGYSETRGMSTTQGRQEGSEPVFADLPTTVHGKDNMLYRAALMLRSLTTATAFINFVDRNGMKATLLNIPDVQSSAPAPAEFEEIRRRVFEASPSSVPIQVARDHVLGRERQLIGRAARRFVAQEPASPAGYRTKRKRSETTLP